MSIPTPSVAVPGGQPAGGRPGQPDQVIIQPAGRSPATWALGSRFGHLAGAGSAMTTEVERYCTWPGQARPAATSVWRW